MPERRRLLAVTIIFIISTVLVAQDNNNNNSEPENTIRRHLGINLKLKIDYEFNQFYPPFIPNRLQPDMFFNDDPSTIWLSTELALSYPSIFSPNNFDAEDHLMSPFYKQYLENSKIDPIRYVLGMAQAAAVGYMAYRHIKKYGFWK